MEFNEYLTRIQGALVTLNRTNGLRKVRAKGGTREKSSLYNALQKILSEYKDNETEMRKIHLYLIFNSDFSFNEEVAKEDEFCHIVHSAPTIDKYLLVETTMLLNLSTFIHEMIVFAHITISLEYLEILLFELRSRLPFPDISAVENITSGINKRLAYLQSGINVGHKDVEKARCKLSFFFKEFLRFFSPPHKDDVMGYVVKSLLGLLQSCLRLRCNCIDEIDEKYKLYSLSLSDYKIECTTADDIDLKNGEDILCILNMLMPNLNLITLSTWMSWYEFDWQLSDGLGGVTKTMQEVIGEQAFLCRQELQRFCDDIPEAATLSALLTNMEIKPITDEDEIEKVQDVSQIISKVKDANKLPESKKKWLVALLNFSWYLKEEECVSCLWEFGNLLNCWEDIYLLQKKVGDLLNGVAANQLSKSNETSILVSNKVKIGEVSGTLKDKMRNLVFEAYSRISVEHQGKLVGTFYKEFGLIDCFHVDNFDKRVTETLNKAVNVSGSKDQLISDLCVLSLQSPEEVVQRLLVLGIGCYTQISFVVEVLKVLSQVCQLNVMRKTSTQNTKNKPPEPETALLCNQLLLLMKQNKWNETENSNLLHLVVQCLDSSILLHEHLLGDCIIPGMEECMENLSWNAINMYIEILNAVLTMPSCPLKSISNPAAILAYMLFILEKGRHDMRKNFSVPAASTCELIISYLPVLLEKMLDQAAMEEKDLDWLRNRILSASPQCQYYYHKLWPIPTNNIIKDYQSLIMLTVYNEREIDEERILDLLTKDHSLLSHFLFKLLPSCTTSEWLIVVKVFKSAIPKTMGVQENLYCHLLQLVSSVLIIMIMTTKRKYDHGNKNILYCIELWFKNYIRIIKEEFWPCLEYFNTSQSIDLFFTVIRILEEVPEDENIRETCSFLVLNILSEIIESVLTEASESGDIKSKNVDNKLDFTKFTACISFMSESESKKGLARKIHEMLHK